MNKATAETRARVGVEPASVGDVTENTAALVFDEVGGPTEGLDIGIVEGFVVCGLGVCHVGRLNSVVQPRIVLVLGIVVGGLLTNGVRRVADDDGDGGVVLGEDALGVGAEFLVVEKVVGFDLAHPEGVAEDDAGEGGVFLLAAGAVVEDILDVDGGDVVGEEDNLVGVELLGVLAVEVVVADKAEVLLEEAGDEGARASEGVEDVDAFIGEAFTEVFAQGAVGGAEDEIDGLDGGEDDAEFFNGGLEGGGEEGVVEGADNIELTVCALDVADADADVLVEAVEGLAVLLGVEGGEEA